MIQRGRLFSRRAAELWKSGQYLDLWFFPLFNIRLDDFEIHSFNLLTTTHNLDTAQEHFEVIEHTARGFQETCQPFLLNNQNEE